MADKREVAKAILDEASHLVTKDRHEQHGDATSTFTKIGEFWAVYLRSRGYDIPLNGIDAVDVAEMMVQVKTIRRSMGDRTNIDNYVDGAGYTSLAGMLSGASFKKD